MKEFILFLLFGIHWSLVLFTIVYALVRRTKKYDWFYFTVITCVLFGWLYNNNECIISLIEKLLLSCDYVYGEEPVVNPSLSLYSHNGSLLLKLGYPILFSINFIVVISDYINNVNVICFVTLCLYCIAIFYHFHHDLRLNKIV